MIDLTKLVARKSKPKPINQRGVFNTLPKLPGINDRNASQAEVLDAWSLPGTCRDIVVKLIPEVERPWLRS